ncbi:MAG: 5-formyltetrahydrofolate cyclo-ligase [Candidatus Latescibacterota bacterium]|nr:5-formyltetrahydrofolate cyclo-ligase [Candidatus Latescibacterota bacterium]
MSVCERKTRLRRQLKVAHKAIQASELEEISRRICQRVTQLPSWRSSKWVHSYIASLAGEIETRPLIHAAWQAGKQIAVPCVVPGIDELSHAVLREDSQLRAGPMGVMQPDEDNGLFPGTQVIDLVIVPGMAFDRQGQRLGRGGGYYDRFLADLRPMTVTVGVVPQRFLLDEVPTEDHDITLHAVLTEAEEVTTK